MNWLNIKLTTAYGIHSAVQRAISTETTQKVKRLKSQRLRIQMRQPVEFLPQSDVHVSFYI
jgi:hypothetical protein